MENRTKTNTTNPLTTLPIAMAPPTNMNTTPQTQHPPLRRFICRGRLSVIVITITHSPQLDGPQLDDSDFTMDKLNTRRFICPDIMRILGPNHTSSSQLDTSNMERDVSRLSFTMIKTASTQIM
jgi:hypothetical protein